VKAEAEKTGFAPNQIASALRLRKTHTIGLIIPDISNSFFAAIARHVEREAARSGYFIILCDSQDSTETEVESIRLLQARSVDGLIISPVGRIGTHLVDLRENGTPVVLVDRYFPDLDLPYVTTDNRQGALDAVSYLIGMGHRRIACIRGLPDSSSGKDREAGYREALTQCGIEIDEVLIGGDDFSEQTGYTEVQRLLRGKGEKPTALFSQGNLIAFGAMRAIAEAGLAIPEDISLISFDDHYYASFLTPPLTTVAQQNEEIGCNAVKLLFKQLDQGAAGKIKGISLPATLVTRKSVAPLRG
jgi:LacI family transcriptional regulator